MTTGATAGHPPRGGTTSQSTPTADGDITIQIKLMTKNSSLIELSYFSLDLLQLMLISQLIEKKEYQTLENLFLQNEKKHLHFPRRNEIIGIFEEHKEFNKTIEIRDLGLGCITLTVVVGNAIGGIIAGVVLNSICKRNKEKIKINFDSKDEKINKLINVYGNESFEKSIDELQNVLNEWGYSFEAEEENIYRIINNNAQRMENTINRVFFMKK